MIWIESRQQPWRATVAFVMFLSSTPAISEVAFGGHVKLDVLTDSDEIGSPCSFVTATIPTDSADNSGGDTNVCVSASKLTLEWKTPTSFGQLRAYVSGDLFGDSLATTPKPRIRQAFLEFDESLAGGELLIGQAWSTFVDFGAWPDIIDFEGPGSSVFTRHTMLRWSKSTGEATYVQISMEEPGTGTVQGAEVEKGLPDFVAAVRWGDDSKYIRAAGVLRDLQALPDTGPTAQATGWGIAASGRWPLSAQNQLVFETSLGEGLGDYYDDAPPSGVYDPATSQLELLPLFAYYVGIQHNWNDTLSTTLLFSELDVDNLELQPDSAGDKTSYGSLNLVWRPDSSLMFGAELLSGQRRDKDGAEGSVFRLQLSAQYAFGD